MKKNVHDVKRTLEDVHETEQFILKDGQKLSRLTHLRGALTDMEQKMFIHHVNEHRDDFSEWIKHSVKDPELAAILKEIHDKRTYQYMVEGAIHHKHKAIKADWVKQKFLRWDIIDFAMGLVIGVGVAAIVVMF